MGRKFSFGTIHDEAGPIEPVKPESPFRIGVLADFRGRRNKDATGAPEGIAPRRLVRVSRDTLDEVMAKMHVRLRLPFGDADDAVALSFAALDDFHPDRIHDQVYHINAADDPAQKPAWMDWVLHHARFQALESAWRGVDWLLGRAARGKVDIVLLDASLKDLSTDLRGSKDLTASGLYQLLINKAARGPSGQPWAALVGNYVFDPTGAHAELLGRLAKIAAQANAPFLTTLDPQVLDPSFAFSPEDAPAWAALRQLPEAAWLGLSVPRFLLRLPYGENTQSIDKFAYEEMSLPPQRSHYLWGNPALGCAALLALAFQKAGWGCKPGSVLELDNLPLHVYSAEGEEEVTLAEAWLTRPQTEQLVKKGIMPFVCVRGKGAVQLARFVSLAQPAEGQPGCDLQGQWGQSGMAPAPPSAAPPLGPKVGMVGGLPPPPRPVKPREPDPLPPPAMPAPAAEEAAPPEPPAPPAEEEMDPDLAALLKPETPPPAEEEMDPDLAALLKQLE